MSHWVSLYDDVSKMLYNKLCIHCSHHNKNSCHRKLYKEISLVSGTIVTEGFKSCIEERESLLPWKCGKQGRFFTPKLEEKNVDKV